MQWIEECVCNSGRPNFDLIEFSSSNSSNSSTVVVAQE